MKLANVIEVRDVPVPAGEDPSRIGPGTRERIEELLRRYPGIDQSEAEEIRHFLSRGSHYEIGRVSGSDEFRDKVAKFREENASYFRLKWWEVMIFLGCTAGPTALLAWRFWG